TAATGRPVFAWSWTCHECQPRAAFTGSARLPSPAACGLAFCALLSRKRLGNGLLETCSCKNPVTPLFTPARGRADPCFAAQARPLPPGPAPRPGTLTPSSTVGTSLPTPAFHPP